MIAPATSTLNNSANFAFWAFSEVAFLQTEGAVECRVWQHAYSGKG
jgi:hypothetical protein